MEFTILAGELAAALNTIKGVIKSGSPIPILSHVKLEAADDQIKLGGTNLEAYAETTTAADIKAAGAACLPGAAFLGLAKAMPKDAEIKIKADFEKGRITTTSGRSKYTLGTLNPEDFPVFKFSPEGSVSFSMPVSDLKAAFDATRQCASAGDEARFYLKGVAICTEGKQLAFVATDGHRLSRLKMEPPEGAFLNETAIVPSASVAAIVSLCGSADADEAEVTISAEKIRVRIGRSVFSSKLIAGTFPDYARVIPRADGVNFSAYASELGAILDRLDAVNEAEGSGVAIKTNGSTVDVRTGRSSSTEAGQETFDAEILAPLEIGMNARYLAHAIGLFPPKAKLDFWASDGSSPMLLTSPDAPGLTHVLMPRRV